MFKDNLKILRKEASLTQEELAKNLRLAKSTISMYESGSREPDFETLEAIADFFNVDMDYLLGKSDIKNRYRQSLDNKKFDIFSIPGIMPLPKTVKRPRLGAISCGDPIMSEENFEGYDNVPTDFNCDFTLKCEGDSMIGARINDGDIVYIKQQSTVENGQIAAVLIDGCEKLLKRVYISNDSVVLQAENPAYPPRVYSKEDMNRVSIIGRAIGFSSIIR